MLKRIDKRKKNDPLPMRERIARICELGQWDRYDSVDPTCNLTEHSFKIENEEFGCYITKLDGDTLMHFWLVLDEKYEESYGFVVLVDAAGGIWNPEYLKDSDDQDMVPTFENLPLAIRVILKLRAEI